MVWEKRKDKNKEMRVKVKDGDTVFWSYEKVTVHHPNGTQTIYYKSLIKTICQRLKSIVQRFKFPKRGTKDGSRPNRNALRVTR